MEADKIVHGAVRMGACSFAHGITDMDRLLEMFYEVPAWEFCIGKNYPDIDVWRKHCVRCRDHDMLVDAGNVSVKNVGRIVLVGNTDAILEYDGAPCSYHVFLLHGAKARIVAGGCSVVFVKASCDSSVEFECKEYGSVL